jgi:ABC-2 type transport system ATP-binding protein
VSLDVRPGITALVGPNGSGKTTLLNLVAGLLRPSKGTVEVLGVPASDPERLNALMGFCTQHDTFHPGLTGEQFLEGLLTLHGEGPEATRAMVDESLDRVGLTQARRRKVGAYSKGMRQRLKLALAMAHRPRVLLLDEPLTGLDPLARAEITALLHEMEGEGACILVSSHVLHEVDLLSEGVVVMQAGRVVAEGGIGEVRGEIRDRPLQVHVACDAPQRLASRAFALPSVRSARMEKAGLLVETFDAVELARLVEDMAVGRELVVEGLEVADENVKALYDYLVRPDVGP